MSIEVILPLVKWAVISDFPSYEISDAGHIRTLPSNIEVPKAKFDGIEYVELWRDGKPYLIHVNRARWAAFPTGANPPISRHGFWLGDRYADGEKAHMCGLVCSVGEV